MTDRCTRAAFVIRGVALEPPTRKPPYRYCVAMPAMPASTVTAMRKLTTNRRPGSSNM